MNKKVSIQVLLSVAFLAVGLIVVNSYVFSLRAPQTTIVETMTTVETAEVVDEKAGFAFTYRIDQGGYSLAKNSLGNGVSVEAIVSYTLTSMADVMAMASNPYVGEGPPTIRLRAYENKKTLPLIEWTNESAIETNIEFSFEPPTETIVAGVPAITFRADGLYAFRVYVLENAGVMYILETAFIDESDPIVADFETLLASVRFIPREIPSSPVPEGVPQNDVFRGVLEEVNVGCFVDGECYVVVDGVKVTVIRGWSNQTVGQVLGASGFGDLEAFIGEEMEVYAKAVGDGTFTLYGDARYYIKLSDSGSLSLRLGETASTLGVTISPVSILEDSRCPSDVVCVWAGTVRIATQLESGLGKVDQEFTLNVPVTTEAETITLVAVNPVPFSQTPTPESEYTFLFKVTKR